MKLRKNQQGSAHVLVIVVVVVAVVGVVALRLSSAQRAPKSQKEAAQQQAQVAKENRGEDAPVPPAPAINNAADLDKAAEVLDKVDPGSGERDTQELDSQLSGI